MIKPTSIAALQTFFFMAKTIPLVASIDEAREALMGNVAEQTSRLSVPIVRILATGDAHQQKCKSFQPDDTSAESRKKKGSHSD